MSLTQTRSFKQEGLSKSPSNSIFNEFRFGESICKYWYDCWTIMEGTRFADNLVCFILFVCTQRNLLIAVAIKASHCLAMIAFFKSYFKGC